jgi:hypothetical protein
MIELIFINKFVINFFVRIRMILFFQEVESVCWYNKGMNFATCHNNGSYALWDAKQQLNIVETEKIPYGPYPCTPMTKVCVKIMRK